MFVYKKITLILAALFIAFGLIAAAFGPAAAAEPECKQWHTVKSGEYLLSIANSYGVSWRTVAEINSLKDFNRIYTGQRLCVSATGVINPLPAPVVVPPTSGIGGKDGRVSAVSVTEDKSVTLQAKGLTANSQYYITMSNFRARISYPVTVGSVTTDSSGAFRLTFDIPKSLRDVIKIKVNAFNLRGDTTSNWFINSTLDGNTGGVDADEFSLSVQSVDKNDWVKIKTSNLPANVTFRVYMSREGKRGVDGILVGTLRHSQGGSITFTFDIPDELADRSKIDIRVENEPLNIFTYRTFENVNSK